MAKAKPSTFFVVNNQGNCGVARAPDGCGTRPRGIIVTNAHVVAGGKQYSVATGDDLKIEVNGNSIAAGPNGKPAKLLGEADCEDIGVLQVSDTSGLVTMPARVAARTCRSAITWWPSATRARSTPRRAARSRRPGSRSAQLTATSGDVSTVKTTFGAIPATPAAPTVGPYQNVILTDTVINHGNSGGPLVNEKAQLVGMNSAGRTDVQGQNYAIAVDRIEQIVPKILAGQKVCPRSGVRRPGRG